MYIKGQLMKSLISETGLINNYLLFPSNTSRHFVTELPIKALHETI